MYLQWAIDAGLLTEKIEENVLSKYDLSSRVLLSDTIVSATTKQGMEKVKKTIDIYIYI